MAPKLRKQSDDSQVGQMPEDENNVNSKENEQTEGLQIGPRSSYWSRSKCGDWPNFSNEY